MEWSRGWRRFINADKLPHLVTHQWRGKLLPKKKPLHSRKVLPGSLAKPFLLRHHKQQLLTVCPNDLTDDRITMHNIASSRLLAPKAKQRDNKRPIGVALMSELCENSASEIMAKPAIIYNFPPERNGTISEWWRKQICLPKQIVFGRFTVFSRLRLERLFWGGKSSCELYA